MSSLPSRDVNFILQPLASWPSSQSYEPTSGANSDGSSVPDPGPGPPAAASAAGSEPPVAASDSGSESSDYFDPARGFGPESSVASGSERPAPASADPPSSQDAADESSSPRDDDDDSSSPSPDDDDSPTRVLPPPRALRSPPPASWHRPLTSRSSSPTRASGSGGAASVSSSDPAPSSSSARSRPPPASQPLANPVPIEEDETASEPESAGEEEDPEGMELLEFETPSPAPVRLRRPPELEEPGPLDPPWQFRAPPGINYVFEPREEWAIAKYYLARLDARKRINWAACGAGIQCLAANGQIGVPSFTSLQYRLFVKYFNYYIQFVDRLGGYQHADKWQEAGVWTLFVWVTNICRLVKTIKTAVVPDPEDDSCWLAERSGDKAGRPSVTMKTGQVEARGPTADNRTSTPRWNVENDSTWTSMLSRLACLLANGLPATPLRSGIGGQQGSHLCFNDPQRCINPGHLVWESDADNKSRTMCGNGSAAYCPHDPKCIFTDLNGRWLPCRNQPEYVKCSCRPSCHKARTNGDKRPLEDPEEGAPEGSRRRA